MPCITGSAIRKLSAAIIALAASLPAMAMAHYPQISPIGDIRININEKGPTINFWISDRETPVDDLIIDYRSDNKQLVPEDDEHISIGGSGQDRNITITPAQDQWGFANITVIVTDSDGDSNREPFMVVVNRPPDL